MLFKIFLSLLLLIHGSLHILGYMRMKAAGTSVRGHQALWYLTAGLFAVSFLLLVLNVAFWWAAGCIAVVVSQLLMIWNWSLARWGTIVNLVLLAAIVFLLC